eukprot:1282286-Amphidinium_carterae.1
MTFHVIRKDGVLAVGQRDSNRTTPKTKQTLEARPGVPIVMFALTWTWQADMCDIFGRCKHKDCKEGVGLRMTFPYAQLGIEICKAGAERDTEGSPRACLGVWKVLPNNSNGICGVGSEHHRVLLASNPAKRIWHSCK